MKIMKTLIAAVATMAAMMTLLPADPTPQLMQIARKKANAGGGGSPPLISSPSVGSGGADFEGLTALPSGWSFEDASGNCILTVEDGKAKIAMPASSHDPGTGSPDPGENAPRIERAQADEDFDVVVAWAVDYFQPAKDVGYGIYVRFSDNSTARHDVYRASDTGIPDNAYVEVRSAGTKTVDNSIKGAANFLRLARSGDGFTFYASLDGSTWITVASYTEVATVAALGFYALNFGTNPAWEAEIEEIRTNTNMPAVNDPVVRTTIFSLDGSAVPGGDDFDDLSATGGSISSDGSEITMSVTSTDRSTAGFLSDDVQAANVGCLALVREDTPQSALFFGIVLRGGASAASQYGPIGHIFEGGSSSVDTRLVKQSRTAPSNVDGGLWSYPREWSAVALPLTATATWVRYEAIGPVIRCKTWNEGDSEPLTWEQSYVDHSFYEGGHIGMAWSKNDSTGASGDLVVEEITFYEISK